MTLFSTVMSGVERGKKVKVNLKQKSLALNRQILIDNGENLTDMELIDENDLIVLNVQNLKDFDALEELYQKYKHSVPSEKSLCNKPYFKALSYEELSDEDMIYGIPRNVAQVMLETYILVMSIKGKLIWENDKHWFWQSEKDKDFVLLREYI